MVGKSRLLIITKNDQIKQKIQSWSNELTEYQFDYADSMQDRMLNQYVGLLIEESLLFEDQQISEEIPIILLQTKQQSGHSFDEQIFDTFDMTKLTAVGMKRGIQGALRQHKIMHDLKEQKALLDNLLDKLSLSQHEKAPPHAHDVKSGSLQDLMGQNKSLLEKAKTKSSELEDLARHDMLTNLPNRFYFTETLNRLLTHAKRHGHILAVLLMDLDRFKHVNDTFGHQTGDLLLKKVADRLKNCVRGGDFIARVGGDEFAIIIHDVQSIHAAGTVAWKILKEIDIPYVKDGQMISIGASIGISFYPMFGDTEQVLLETADIAMYEAKKITSSHYCYATAELQDAHERWRAIEQGLRDALTHDEFSLAYQPIYRLDKNKVYGFEILLRWRNKKLGNVPPLDFIPIAEATGHMPKITEWIMDTACEQIKSLQKAVINSYKFSINLSPNQLKQENILQLVNQSLQKHDLNPNCLQFEITEMAILHEHNQAGETVKKLYDLGVSQALDHFGVGYSSIAHVKYLPISAIKIDRTFIAEINRNQANNDIIESIILFAKKMKMQVIAEGIETKTQLNYLISKNCPFGQGFYFCKPVPFSKVQSLIQQYVLAEQESR